MSARKRSFLTTAGLVAVVLGPLLAVAGCIVIKVFDHGGPVPGVGFIVGALMGMLGGGLGVLGLGSVLLGLVLRSFR